MGCQVKSLLSQKIIAQTIDIIIKQNYLGKLSKKQVIYNYSILIVTAYYERQFLS